MKGELGLAAEAADGERPGPGGGASPPDPLLRTSYGLSAEPSEPEGRTEWDRGGG